MTEKTDPIEKFFGILKDANLDGMRRRTKEIRKRLSESIRKSSEKILNT